MLASIKNNERGFTLAEMNAALAILAIITVALGTAFVNYLVIITRTNLSVEMTTNSQVLLRTVAEELRYGAGVRQTNTISDPNAPVGGWNTSNVAFVIITAIPAVDSADNYIIDINTGKPYINELVYYKQGGNLLKRVLAHPEATGNSLKRSCPAAIATLACPADRVLAQHFNTMVFTLYNQDNGTTLVPTEARSVKIDLSLTRETYGNPISMTNSVRTTLRNTF